MSPPELIVALQPVVEALEELNVSYFIGGSVASSSRGIPRASLDVDIVAELRAEQVPDLVQRLQPAFYVDEERARTAVATRRSFNLIHLDTMIKIDVFVSKNRAFDQEAQRRAQPEQLEDTHERDFRLATAEDIILAKLEWYKAGDQVSDRQWGDVLGVLKTQGARIDEAYLRRWAADLGLTDLLDRALEDSGDHN